MTNTFLEATHRWPLTTGTSRSRAGYMYTQVKLPTQNIYSDTITHLLKTPTYDSHTTAPSKQCLSTKMNRTRIAPPSLSITTLYKLSLNVNSRKTRLPCSGLEPQFWKMLRQMIEAQRPKSTVNADWGFVHYQILFPTQLDASEIILKMIQRGEHFCRRKNGDIRSSSNSPRVTELLSDRTGG